GTSPPRIPTRGPPGSPCRAAGGRSGRLTSAGVALPASRLGLRRGGREVAVKTLMLQGGDLELGPQGHRTITGSSKIRQDLALALGEESGTDRFRTNGGSGVPCYAGRPWSADTGLLVRSETGRVVQVYIDIQRAEIVNDTLAGRRSRYTTGDVVSRR